MQNQRILAITIKQDVSRVNDDVVEAIKEMWRTQLKGTDFQVSFEVREIDPYARVKSMLRLVSSEFEVDDDEPALTDSERPDLVEDEP